MSDRRAPKRCSRAGDSLREFVADWLGCQPAWHAEKFSESLPDKRSGTRGFQGLGGINFNCRRIQCGRSGKFFTFGVTRGCIEVASPVSSITWVIPP